jgi:glutamate--cysteine ligase
MRMSQQHKNYYSSCNLGPERRAMFTRLTEESLARQQSMEADNDESFADYLARYFAQPV